MRPVLIAALGAAIFLSACAGSSNLTTVDGTGPNDLLKLRAGPGLGYDILLGLPDGTPLIRRDCVTEVGQLWCRVSLARSPEITGYVSADYLSDG